MEPDHPCPAPRGALLPRQAARPQHYRDCTKLSTRAPWHTENLAEKADNHIAFSLLICFNPSLSTACTGQAPPPVCDQLSEYFKPPKPRSPELPLPITSPFPRST